MPSNILFQSCDVFFWTIIGLGSLALLMALERFFALQRSRIDETDLLSGIITNLKHGNINEAIAICEDTPGPVAHIVAEAIRQRNVPRADLVSILHSEGLAEISRMERRLSVLALIAQVAPILGLLGTVLALLKTVLQAEANAPFVQSSDFLHGLVPALTTTAAGLLVALPAFAGFNALVVKIDRLVLDMEHAAAEIVQFLDANRSQADPRQRKLGL
jgi:biopolymer transport protein ExbB